MSETLKLVAATRNIEKLSELQRLLGDMDLDVVSLDSFTGITEVHETGVTFEENARLKALSYAEQTGLPCVADDSGLEVEALNGAPGVHSARYAGPGANSEALCRKLLAEMEDVPEGKRNARFRCFIAFAMDGEIAVTSQGEARGAVIREMRGSEGFGYDPVFVPEGHDKTYAEMPAHQKDKISHRGKALAIFKDKLSSLLRKG
jgi:XTP/dITP diphosphohydrolase